MRGSEDRGSRGRRTGLGRRFPGVRVWGEKTDGTGEEVGGGVVRRMGRLVRLMGRGGCGDSDEDARAKVLKRKGKDRREWRRGGAGGNEDDRRGRRCSEPAAAAAAAA